MKLKKIYLLLILVISILTLFGCGNDRNSKEQEILRSLSWKARVARNYIDNLPEEQKAAFYTGVGDRANLIANLMASGHIDGAEEYIKALQKIEDLDK